MQAELIGNYIIVNNFIVWWLYVFMQPHILLLSKILHIILNNGNDINYDHLGCATRMTDGKPQLNKAYNFTDPGQM